MNVEVASEFLLDLIEQAQRLTVMIRRAEEEGRDSLTDEEVALLASEYDAAGQRLGAAIEDTRKI